MDAAKLAEYEANSESRRNLDHRCYGRVAYMMDDGRGSRTLESGEMEELKPGTHDQPPAARPIDRRAAAA